MTDSRCLSLECKAKESMNNIALATGLLSMYANDRRAENLDNVRQNVGTWMLLLCQGLDLSAPGLSCDVLWRIREIEMGFNHSKRGSEFWRGRSKECSV